MTESGATEGVDDESQPSEKTTSSKNLPQSNDVNGASTSSSRASGPTKNDDGADKERILLQKATEKLHCPFYWQADIPINSCGNHDIDLLSDFDDMFEGTSFQFRRFVVHLVMCYHSFNETSVATSIGLLKRMEGMLVYSARKDCKDFLFNTIRDALYHISHSCHIFIHEKTNQIEKAHQILEKITAYESMNAANKAAVWGIRAAVYAEYGYEGVTAAVKFAEKAIELDPINAFWHFYRGVYLGRLRRIEKGRRGPMVPTDVEIECLQTALKLRKEPVFYAFIAETYLELVKSIRVEDFPPQCHEILKKKVDKVSAKAAELFEQCVAVKENSAHFLFRCGKGFMRLPPPYQNLRKAKSLLKTGLEISPKSSYGNHAMAMFKMEYENDYEAAEFHLEQSKDRKNFQAHMDFCRMRYLQDDHSSEFLTSELESMLKIYKEIPKRGKIYGELILCYLFVDYKLIEACKHAESLLELQTELIDYIYEFKSGLLPFSQPVALIDLLAAETALRRQRKEIVPAEKEAYTAFLELLVKKKVQFHDVSKNIFQKYSDDLKKGLTRKHQRMDAVENRLKEEQRMAEHRDSRDRNERSDVRDASRSPPREREKSNVLRSKDKRNSSARKGTAALIVEKKNNPPEKPTPSLPTKELSMTEKIEAYMSDLKREAEGPSRASNVTKPDASGDKARKRSGRDQSADRKSIRSNRSKRNDRNRSSSGSDRQSRSSRLRRDRRSRSPDPKSVTSSRSKKTDRHHSRASPDRHSQTSHQKRNHRSPSADRKSITSNRSKKTGRHHSTSPGRHSRTSHRRRDDRSRSAERKSVKDERKPSSSSWDKLSRSSRREYDERDPCADTKSVRSNHYEKKDSSHRPDKRSTRSERSPGSAASSRRKERSRRSSSSSPSVSRSSKRKSKRSVSRDSRQSRRSRESGRRHRSDSSKESRRSDARADGEKRRSYSRSSRRDRRKKSHGRRERSSSASDRSRKSYKSKGSRARYSSDERDGSRRRPRRERSPSDQSDTGNSSSSSSAYSRASKRNVTEHDRERKRGDKC